MKREVGVIMDPIGSITIKKDSTFAMMLAAQRVGWRIWYMEPGDLRLRGSLAEGRMREIQVEDHPDRWFRFAREEQRPLGALDCILMRKDPPFDMEYVYATYILENARQQGCLVVNDPTSLRDANEKLFATHFDDCISPTLVTRNSDDLLRFLNRQMDVILKPLDGMGGASIFRVRKGDPNFHVIVETLTDHGRRFCMAQRFIPEIKYGDKRILVIDGEPVPYALARIPREGETRGNLAAGGRGQGVALTDRDRWICERVGPELRTRGILFAGLDVIGDYLTEINVTSPTCIRELDALYGLDIAGQLLAAIEEKLDAG